MVFQKTPSCNKKYLKAEVEVTVILRTMELLYKTLARELEKRMLREKIDNPYLFVFSLCPCISLSLVKSLLLLSGDARLWLRLSRRARQFGC